MADTHDNLKATEKAVDFFNKEAVDHVLHAGDLVSPFTVNKFENLEAEFHFVWGNNEGDHFHIRNNFKDIGIEPEGDFSSLEFSGRKIALLHGENEEIVDALSESGVYDVVIRGHTHEPEIRENPLVINPGATSGYLSDSKTVVLLDTKDLEPELIEI
ncbi:hypothetical protein AKJ53_00030 [candidate division MSBL1 archaeon SCGC-AAA382F02]|uniref:Phosphoesterase n=1 Tax=candidate division MSBL1 archaeon SCGC-AAA382F02 TaxID=1698282 RepID=A0A133VJB0_9EURY|nr:hypothetical protein AKJ53_00030 [candidate division MSBL1 archaeon SCGC-AAA382F02]